MATRKAVNQAINAAADDQSEAVFQAASADLNIVRAAGITNGMEPDEMRRRILAAAAAAKD